MSCKRGNFILKGGTSAWKDCGEMENARVVPLFKRGFADREIFERGRFFPGTVFSGDGFFRGRFFPGTVFSGDGFFRGRLSFAIGLFTPHPNSLPSQFSTSVVLVSYLKFHFIFLL